MIFSIHCIADFIRPGFPNMDSDFWRYEGFSQDWDLTILLFVTQTVPSELSCQSRGLYQSSACALCSCCAETSQSSAACHLTCETLRPSGWGMMYSTVITQGAPGHTTVPDDCQYTTETLTVVFCASLRLPGWMSSCECYVTRGHTVRTEGLSQSL